MSATTHPRPPQAERPRVLLVEDDLAHADLIRRGLEGHGVPNTVTHVQDGEEALDYLLHRGAFAEPESAPRPEVVLLDLRLPKLDGLEVLAEIRRRDDFDDLPVVVLTTSSAIEDVQQAYRNRANSYLVKPLDFDHLEQLIEDFGNYWLQWNESLR